MLDKLKVFIGLSNSLITLYKKNTIAFIMGVLLLSVTTYYNVDYIKETVYGKPDITIEYLEKTYQVETKLDYIRNVIECDEINISMLHNGEMTLSRLHLMKFTMLFQSTLVQNNNKFRVYRQHLAPYVSYFNEMVDHGFYYVEDTEHSVDAMSRAVFKSYGHATIIFVPLFKDNILVAFATTSWSKIHHMTSQDIQDLIRMLDVPESDL